MNIVTLIAQNLGVLVVAMTGLWLVSLALKNASIVDIFWGIAFVIVAWFSWLSLGRPDHGVVVVVCTTLWGARLATYLALRNIGKPEDVRYQQLRAKHVPFWWKSLPIVFWLQAVLATLVSLPLQLSQLPRDAGKPVGVIGVIDVVAVVVFAFGLAFESVADWQMAAHKRRRERGAPSSVLNTGLWRYSRHPNYFGEAVAWWGLGLFTVATALSSSSMAPFLGLVGPVLITWLLTRLSGVPMLEAVMKDRPGYPDYVARTSTFVPRAPRATSSS